MTDQLLENRLWDRYQIITDGTVVGYVEEEVYGWAARRSFPTTPQNVSRLWTLARNASSSERHVVEAS